jgi:hypothetical protein
VFNELALIFNFFSGKSLTDMTASLEFYGLKSGSKVMVLGSKVSCCIVFQ